LANKGLENNVSKIVLSKKITKQIKDHPLYTKDKKIVIGRGNLERPEFLIFGEAPGNNENYIGYPFVGLSGSVLDFWIKGANVDSFYISNVVPLIPLKEKYVTRKPTKKELSTFSFFVEYIVDRINPKFVITLGDSATWSLIKKEVSSIKGKVDNFGETPVTGIYHPARYFRIGEYKTTGLSDFKKAVTLLRNCKKT
jgi:DNA polymerase